MGRINLTIRSSRPLTQLTRPVREAGERIVLATLEELKMVGLIQTEQTRDTGFASGVFNSIKIFDPTNFYPSNQDIVSSINSNFVAPSVTKYKIRNSKNFVTNKYQYKRRNLAQDPRLSERDFSVFSLKYTRAGQPRFQAKWGYIPLPDTPKHEDAANLPQAVEMAVEEARKILRANIEGLRKLFGRVTVRSVQRLP